MKRLAPALGLLLALGYVVAAPAPEPRWWRGNTHTHTLWSDGDGAPDGVVGWYASNGYDFLVLSDHNVFADHERWMKVGEGERLKPAHVVELVQSFGADAVDLRERDGGQEMRLRTLDELAAQFNVPEDFLLVPGEEVTNSFEGKPVHVNALNLVGLVPPVQGQSVLDTMQRAVDAIVAHGREHGRPVLAHIDHPNFYYAITAEELAQLRGERFFEVYNGHPSVNNEGDDAHPSTERMWDEANTLRVTELELPLLYGVATDDAHNYHQEGPSHSNTGRGWIQVRAVSLDAEQLIAAMNAGDFYASSGVELESIESDGGVLRVHIAAEEGVEYTVQFRGTRRTRDGIGQPGELLLSTGENPASYSLQGDELFVRATITSTKTHPNPYIPGDVERAWVQPVRP